MKLALKITTIAIVAGTVSFFAACNNSNGDKKAGNGNQQHDSTVTNQDADPVFACPMHPEVTGREGGACSKCGMKLERNDIKNMKH